MKKILLSILTIVAVVFMTSCEKETEDIATGSVYYPVFVNSGSQLNVVGLGESFTVPEVTVYEGDKDITDQATITGEVDLSTPGYYSVTYEATTSDGYTGSYEVIVFVYHPDYKEAPIAGDYNGSLSTIGGGPVTIKEFQKGVYTIDDAFAGFYNVYNGYGSVYMAPGYLIYVGNNNFILRNCTSPWGAVLDDGGVSYDPATGIIMYGAYFPADGYNWSGLPFILTPVVE